MSSGKMSDIFKRIGNKPAIVTGEVY